MTDRLTWIGAETGRSAPEALWRRVGGWVAENVRAERDRWLLWVPVLFGIGIGGYFGCLDEPPLWPGPTVLAGVAGAAIALRRMPRLLVACFAVGLVAAGFTMAQVTARSAAAPVLGKRLGPVEITGQIVEVESLSEGWRVLMAPSDIQKLDPAKRPVRIRIRLDRRSAPVDPGDWITVPAILLPPPAPALPGGWDFQRQAWFDRLGAVGYATGAAVSVPPPDGSGSSTFLIRLNALRHTMTQRILTALPGATGAITASLITGERGAIPETVNADFRDSGLAHLLSISGIHMALVAGLAFVGLRALLALIPALALRFPIKKWAAALALLILLFYLLISGNSVPAQRSFAMTGLGLTAVLIDRLHISMRVVAWAGLAVLIAAPASMIGPSFQMSFGAVVALIAFYETYGGQLVRFASGGWSRRALLYLAGIGITTMLATVSTAGFGIYHFNRFALYSLAANLIAVPLSGIWVMPFAMVACLLMPFGLEAWALQPLGWGVDVIIAAAASVAHWPGAVLPIPEMPLAGLLLVTFGGLWLAIWQRPWRCWGLVAFIAGLASVGVTRPPDILISGDGKLIAARAEDGQYLLSSARPARQTAESWARRSLADGTGSWPAAGEVSPDHRLACDRLGCLYRAQGYTVALVTDARALAEDCRKVDLVVSEVPVRGSCRRRTRVVDRFDVWRAGGHAIWLDTDIRVESVDGVRGLRPWVPQRGP
jgi:competence protein ComEC